MSPAERQRLRRCRAKQGKYVAPVEYDGEVMDCLERRGLLPSDLPSDTRSTAQQVGAAIGRLLLAVARDAARR